MPLETEVKKLAEYIANSYEEINQLKAENEKLRDHVKDYMDTCQTLREIIAGQKEDVDRLIAENERLTRRLADSCYEERSNALDYGTPCEGAIDLEQQNAVLREALEEAKEDLLSQSLCIDVSALKVITATIYNIERALSNTSQKAAGIQEVLDAVEICVEEGEYLFVLETAFRKLKEQSWTK